MTKGLKATIAAAVDNKPVTLKDRLNTWVGGNPVELIRHVGSQKEAARLVQCFFDAAAKVPKLYEADPKSVMSCLAMSAQTKLYPGAMQEVAFVPFFNSKLGKSEAVWMPMFSGLLKLAYNSQYIKSISVDVVCKGDVFELVKGTEERLTHIPKFETDEVEYAYCVIHLATGGKQVTVLPLKFINGIKARSRASKSSDSPWNNPEDFKQMAKKTALKQALKYVPKSIELAEAITFDNQAESGEEPLLQQDAGEEQEAIEAIFSSIEVEKQEQAEVKQ